MIEYGPLSQLARDLGRLDSEGTAENVLKAVEHSARRVKDRWNGKLYREGHASLTGRAISYDVGGAADVRAFATDAEDTVNPGDITAVIGAKRGQGKQAGVVRLLENGSVNNPPHGYGAASIQEEEADFAAGIDFAIAAAERAAGFS